MFKKLCNKLGLEISEILSISILVATLASIMYKTALFRYLNAEWYLSFLSSQQIIFTSLMILFCFITGIIIGLLLAQSLLIVSRNHRNKINLLIQILNLPIAYIIMKLEILEVSIICLNIILSYNMRININRLKEIEIPLELKIVKTYLFIIIIILGITPIIAGLDKGKRIINETSKTLNKVEIEGNKENWYLVDTNATEALLINEKTKSYKIIKTEDITEIKQR